MFGIITKKDKKALQKIRENKEKDTEIWPFIIRRESMNIITSGMLLAFGINMWNEITMGNRAFENKIIGAIVSIYAILNFIGTVMVIFKLTGEDKK